MKNILLVNAGKSFAHSHGQLNATLHETAIDTIGKIGLNTQQTIVDVGYDVSEEVAKIKWADAVIYQMPGWWMGPPWILKKYFDEVFTAGHGVLYESDGRTRSDPTKKYGSGGLVQDKRYMLSLTWNAPLEAFTEKDQFFEGVGVDGVYLPVHKANQFLGMRPLPTFICNDVIKKPQIEKFIADYSEHLRQVFAAKQ
ncbi:MAG: NAD(P)H-dependent oxidoreductase [Burkholderiales bacterium]|jgi:modulator of drug activity B|nr:NAD(P)H-dependent oxidoreductase [Burkholderiales bacterium]